MRTDAKIGVLCALIVGLVAGGYFTFRGPAEEPITLGSTPAEKPTDRPAARSRPELTPKAGTDIDRSRDPRPRPTDTGQPTGSNRIDTGRAAPERTGGQDAANTGRAAERDRSPTPPLPLTSSTGEPSVSNPQPGLTQHDPTAGSNSPSQGGPALTDAGPSNRPDLVGITTPGGSQPGRAIGEPRTPVPGSMPVSRSGRTPSVGGRNETHSVLEGDTFSSLCIQYYGDERHLQTLIKANPQVANPDVLKIGTVLQIPRLGDGSAAEKGPAGGERRPTGGVSSGARTYVVQSGDSFYKIARDELGDPLRWQELFEINRSTVGDNPNSLRTGAVLVLPEK
jgi:nucleoid-associated protein YgaU